MAVGIEIFDSTGALNFSATDRLTRVLGSVAINGTDGSTTSSQLVGNSTWWAFFPDSVTSNIYHPTVDISGSTVTWSYGNASLRVSGILVFGIY